MTTSPTELAGILFDKDGTLLDYHLTWMPLNRGAALEVAGDDAALAERLLVAGGYDPVADRTLPGSLLAASNNREIAEFWVGELADAGIARAVDDVYAIINRQFARGAVETAVPVTDLPALMTGLRGRGLKLGIATSDSTSSARDTVNITGLADLMDFVAGYDAGHGAKPGPGMVHGFCRELGLDSAAIMVVGDNAHDIEMGRNGGAGWTVGVLTGTSGRDDLEHLADHVIDSIDALPDLIDELFE